MSRLVVARHYRTGANLELELEREPDQMEEQLVGCRQAPPTRENHPDCWIAPALVDLQINGYAGIDFQSDSLEERDLLHACAALHRDGCGYFFLTLITDQWPRMLQKLAHLKALRDNHSSLRNTITGWHLEGPFLSDQPGFHGAHNPEFMLDPLPEHVQAIKTIAGEDLVMLTIAPERRGAANFIRAATREGFTICLGHTDASREQLDAAIDAGAVAITHLGNAVPQQLHRHNNVLWRMLDSNRISASLIPDGVHLPAAVLRSFWSVMGPERLFFTTDAMAAASAPPGRYRIGRLEVEVGGDKIVRQPGSLNFAGSALEPSRGVQLAAGLLRIPWQDAWHAFSEVPLRILGKSRDCSSHEPGARTAMAAMSSVDEHDTRTKLSALRPTWFMASKHCLIPFDQAFEPATIKLIHGSPGSDLV